MKPLIRILRAETTFPLLVILSALSGLSVMGLANYARPAAPSWYGPMSFFLLLQIGFALRDLIRARGRG